MHVALNVVLPVSAPAPLSLAIRSQYGSSEAEHVDGDQPKSKHLAKRQKKKQQKKRKRLLSDAVQVGV